ncbi:hypothetical protein CR513_61186, partial [Mucuna pruriens]
MRRPIVKNWAELEKDLRERIVPSYLQETFIQTPKIIPRRSLKRPPWLDSFMTSIGKYKILVNLDRISQGHVYS